MANNSKKDIVKSALDKVKLVDAGVKNKYGCCELVKSSSSPEDRVYYPNLYLDSKEAPMMTDSEVGDEVTLLIKTRVVSHSVNENSDKKNENFSLEIRQIGVVSTNKAKKD